MTNNEFTVCYAELVHDLMKAEKIPKTVDGWNDIYEKYKLTDEENQTIRDTKRRSREERMVKTQREELSRSLRICKVALEKMQNSEITFYDICDDMTNAVIYTYIVTMSVADRLNTKKAFYDLGIRELSIKYSKKHHTEDEMLKAS